MRPGAERRAESAADVGIDHVNGFSWNAEHAGNFVCVVVNPLGLVPEGELVALPLRNRCVGLHGVVVFTRLHVRLIYPVRGSGERTIGITLPAFGAAALLLCRRRSRLRTRGVETGERVCVDVIFHSNE